MWPRLLCISETLQSKKVALHLTSVAGVFIFLDKTFFYLPCTVEVEQETRSASTTNRRQCKFLTFYRPNKWNLFLKDFTPQKRNLEEVLFGRILACLHQLFRSNFSNIQSILKLENESVFVPFLFQCDRGFKHKASFIIKKPNCFCVWKNLPACQSPDLKPIQHFWDDEEHARRYHPTTVL